MALQNKQVEDSFLDIGEDKLENEQQLKKAIKTLRLRTQETIADSQDEIAQLDEENELKQIRLDEIDQELRELTGKTSLSALLDSSPNHAHKISDADKSIDTRSLVSGRPHGFSLGAFVSRSTSRRASIDDDETFNDDASQSSLFSQRFSLASLGDYSSRYFGGKKSNKDKDIKRVQSRNISHISAISKGKMHEFEEESKKIIQQLESDLSFKQEQVTALQLALEEQDNIVENLEQEIEHLHEDPPDKGDFTSENLVKMEERLIYLNDQERRLLIQIRLARRIKNTKEDEQTETVLELKREKVESSLRMKAVKQKLEANKELLEKEIISRRWEWALLGIKLALAQRVSLKQVRRLQRKAAKGDSEDWTELIERATRALDEELLMRDSVHPNNEALEDVRKEGRKTKEIADSMLCCCRAYMEEVETLKNKKIPTSIMKVFLEILIDMERYLEAMQPLLSLALSNIKKACLSYAPDETLVPDDIQTAFVDIGNSSDTVANSEHYGGRDDLSSTGNATTNKNGYFRKSNHGRRRRSIGTIDTDTATSITTNFSNLPQQPSEKLRSQKEELCSRIVMVQEDIEALREQIEMDISEYKTKLSRLKEDYDNFGKKWDLKDDEIEHSMREVEEAKFSEDKVRIFLERTVESKSVKAAIGEQNGTEVKEENIEEKL